MTRLNACAGAALSALALVVLVSSNIAMGHTAIASDRATAPQDETIAMDEPARPTFSAWLAEFRAEALEAGISAAVLDPALADLSPDPRVLELLQSQPEHTRAIWEYLSLAVSDKRVAEGLEKLKEHADVLGELEARYGVPRTVLVAIWGLESSYGVNPGSRPVVRSLATLAYAGERRAKFGRAQLLAALEILERGDIGLAGLVGSWAGAMGHTQFIPTTYNAHAVDFDGDGKRDIWGSPVDALASTANYLRESGWEPGKPWGREVSLPDNFDYALADSSVRKSADDWAAVGVAVPGEGASAPLSGDDEGHILLPMGATGPAFLVFRNYRAILRYNRATSYAVAISHLSDRLAGQGAFVQPWPRDLRPLSFSERKELQTLLAARGFDTGGIDGIIGRASKAALRTVQGEFGIAADAYASVALLERLRATTELTTDATDDVTTGQTETKVKP